MYSLLRILFKSSYWQLLGRKATWFEAWLSLGRAHKDRRARKKLLGLFLLLIIPFLLIGYLAWIVGSGGIFLVPFVVAIMWWRKRREKQDAVPSIAVPITSRITPKPSTEDRKLVRHFFAEQSVIHAVMVDRAVSESFLKWKTLPEGFVVTSRRVHLDLLQSADLLGKMSSGDRAAVMTADGHWEEKQIHEALSALEPLLLLRWILRIDYYLPVIGLQLQGNAKMASELINARQKTFNGKGLVDESAIQTAKGAAHEYYARCLAEIIDRGYVKDAAEESARWAGDVVHSMGGKQHEDLTLGSRLVSEATKDELFSALSRSRVRLQFLEWAIRIIEHGEAPFAPLSVFKPDEMTEATGNRPL